MKRIPLPRRGYLELGYDERPWTEGDVIRMWVAMARGEKRNEIVSRSQHSLAECDLMAWLKLGRSPRQAISIRNRQDWETVR